MVLRGAISSDYFGKAYLGRTMGALMGGTSIGGIVGPTLAGWTFDATDSYRVFWLSLCPLVVSAALMVLRISPVDSGTR